PEEINRILTDTISQWLFVSEPSGRDNLWREGIHEERIFFVGNIMIDTLIACREQIAAADPGEIDLPDEDYAVLTLHRPSNVDDPVALRGLMNAIEEVQRELPIVFPVHPRTKRAMEA